MFLICFTEAHSLVRRQGRRLALATKRCLALEVHNLHLTISQPQKCSLVKTTRVHYILMHHQRVDRQAKMEVLTCRQWRPRINLVNLWSNFSGAGRFYPLIEFRNNTKKLRWNTFTQKQNLILKGNVRVIYMLYKTCKLCRKICTYVW